MTPYEAWRKKKPTVDYFRTFGCVAHVKLVGPGVTKLADRSRPGIFLGYEAGTKGYRVYDPVGKRLYITRDVRFEEEWRWDWSKDGGDLECAHQFTVVYSDAGAPTTTTYSVSPEPTTPPGTPMTPTAPASPLTPSTPRTPPYGGSTADTPSATSTSASADSSPSTPATPYDSDDGWVTPPTGEDYGAEGVPVRWKSMEYVIDHAPTCTLEYNGLCLSAAEEPASVQEALDEPALRSAMEAEMESIRSNDT